MAGKSRWLRWTVIITISNDHYCHPTTPSEERNIIAKHHLNARPSTEVKGYHTTSTGHNDVVSEKTIVLFLLPLLYTVKKRIFGSN